MIAVVVGPDGDRSIPAQVLEEIVLRLSGDGGHREGGAVDAAAEGIDAQKTVDLEPSEWGVPAHPACDLEAALSGGTRDAAEGSAGRHVEFIVQVKRFGDEIEGLLGRQPDTEPPAQVQIVGTDAAAVTQVFVAGEKVGVRVEGEIVKCCVRR